jgi:hypothetical protein
MDTLTTELINTGLNVAGQIKGGDLINGVPNSLLSTIATVLFGFVYRAIEKRKLRKKGVLIDKALNDSTK